MIVDLILNNAKAYVNRAIVDCSLALNNGKIFKIGKEAQMPKTDARMDLRNLLVLPGLIDAHVHLRDEGKSCKEDFYSGTAAAAAGGFATVLDMPNNDPVTMSAGALRNRTRIAGGSVLVNVGFYSEFPENSKEIEQIVKEGPVAFKLFMTEQVGGLNIYDDKALLEAFRIIKRLEITVNVHAEDRTTLKNVEDKLKRANRNDAEAFLEAHSENAEYKAVERLLDLVKQTKTRVHFCHISTKKGLDTIIEGKKSAMPLTCEVTMHHLLLSVSDLKKIGTIAITVPPVREKQHITALWNGLKNGWIDFVASDHAPHMLKEKEAKNIWDVKVGIPALETTLPLLLTETKRGRLTLGDLVRLLSEKPAELFRLKGKGSLKEGDDADLTIVDLDEKYKIDASKFNSKAKYSPFDGWQVEGKAAKTFVNGQLIMDDGQIVAKAGSGRIFRRR